MCKCVKTCKYILRIHEIAKTRSELETKQDGVTWKVEKDKKENVKTASNKNGFHCLCFQLVLLGKPVNNIFFDYTETEQDRQDRQDLSGKKVF